ncbi:response regulator transcription factor [Altererythrobacter sp. Root672]|uniref:response regulator transcription factor n=1 Tax=Altererythrobacter sp. Root672 TaxID=1736584 RepID=UPI001910193B|nr:response regulator transcription factor [Altererythrobacter sp. Root672]
MLKLLLIEDDPSTASFIVQGLAELGHSCDHVGGGLDGLTAAMTHEYDAIILDRNLPQMDGLTVLTAFRAEDRDTPVLFLSALGQVDDRVAGLNAGADDYLPKPFSFQELLARIIALSRRRGGGKEAETVLTTADLSLDRMTRAATRGERRIELLPKEYQLLDYLMRHAGQVVTRTMLLEAIWDYSFNPGTNVIDVHISRLRGKIDAEGETPLIHTVRGAGYRLGGN